MTKIKSNCVIDINDDEGVIAITLGGKHNRFFIFKDNGNKIQITKERAWLDIEIPILDENNVYPANMVYAHRRWTTCPEGVDYKFEIELSHRHFTSFKLRCKKGTCQKIYEELINFFN